MSDTGGSSLEVYLASRDGVFGNSRSQTVTQVSRGSLLHLVVRIASYHRPVSPIGIDPPAPHDCPHPNHHDVDSDRVAKVIGIVGVIATLLGVYVRHIARSSQSPEPRLPSKCAMPEFPYRLPAKLERSRAEAVGSGPRPLP